MWSALGVVYLVWGSTYLAIAIAVQTLPPLLSAGLRFLLAGVILGAWLALRYGRAALRIDRAQLGGAALVGMLLLAGGNGLVVLAERTVPSGLTALVVASVPLWIVVFRLIAGDRVAASLIGGVIVGFAGVALLVVPRGASGEVDPLGLVMVVGATFSWALGTFASPRLRTPRDPLASTAVQMLAGGVLLVVIAVATGEPARADPSTFSTASLLAMAYLVVFGSLVAFSAYTWLLQHASVSVVSTYAYVNPVVAVLLGAVVLSEAVTPSMLVGAAIILAAVAFIVSRSATRSA
ncbi:MAG TPA: EamA family transporter [Candidatus Limnocylindria bacterium]|nr:EamA family transporter [Candidatus Limnocylindria bacterium]